MTLPAEKLQYKTVAWLDAAGDVLRNSAWSPALSVENVDVLDALRTPLLFTLLSLARINGHQNRLPTIRERLWKTVGHWGYHTKVKLQEARAYRVSELPQPATVLFWPQLISHIKQLPPIAAELRSLGITTGFLMNRPLEFEKLRLNEPNTAFIGRAWPDQLNNARRRAFATVPQLRSDPGVALPQFLCDLDEQLILGELRACISQNLASVHLAAAGCVAAIEQLRPEVLVVGNDITVEGRTQCAIANARGVLTVCPMHGIVSGEPLQGRHVAEAVLVYGERSRKDLIQLGENPDRIHVCGAAHLNNRQHPTGRIRPEIKEFLQLNDGDPWVLVATSGPGHSVSVEHHCRMIEAVCRLSAAMPTVRFVAKLHPKDRLEYYTAARRVVTDSRLITVSGKSQLRSLDFTDWLQGCPAVITGGSAAGLDALLMDVPVISIDLANELTEIDFVVDGASLHVRNEIELASSVERVLFSPESLTELRQKSRKFLNDAFYELDGNPAQIAAGTILRLCPSKAVGR